MIQFVVHEEGDGVDIGKVVAPIARGEHTHVQNLKTKRW